MLFTSIKYDNIVCEQVIFCLVDSSTPDNNWRSSDSVTMLEYVWH